jgi:endonuclease YncB( thermonuclease family)
VRATLSSLQPNEAFFSIDEFGPFAVRKVGGRALMAPGELCVIPESQKARGWLILTGGALIVAAALLVAVLGDIPREARTARPRASMARASWSSTGDTFAIGEERIRILNIDTPETRGSHCENELVQGLRAKERLASLLRPVRIDVARDGRDRYGRTLARVSAQGRDVGEVLIREGLALQWQDGPRAKAAYPALVRVTRVQCSVAFTIGWCDRTWRHRFDARGTSIPRWRKTTMTDDGTRQERIRRAAERAAGSLASDEDLIDPGSLAEMLSGVALADIPDATSAEIQSAFASLWALDARTIDCTTRSFPSAKGIGRVKERRSDRCWSVRREPATSTPSSFFRHSRIWVQGPRGRLAMLQHLPRAEERMLWNNCVLTRWTTWCCCQEDDTRALLVAIRFAITASAFAQGTNPSGGDQCRQCATALNSCLDACSSEDYSERCRWDHNDYDCEVVCPQPNQGRTISEQTKGSRLFMSRPQRLQAMPLVASWPSALLWWSDNAMKLK